MPEISIFEDEKKFMWDGESYDKKHKAETKAEEYLRLDFETRLTEENNVFFVYTRRVAENQEPEESK